MQVSKRDVEIILNWAYTLERRLEAEGYDVSDFYTERVARAHERLMLLLRTSPS